LIEHGLTYPQTQYMLYGRANNRKWPMGDRLVMRPMTSHDPERSNSWTLYALSEISRTQLGMLF